MTMQQRTEPSPAAVLISVAVLALVLTVAFGPLGFVIGLALFALMFIGTRGIVSEMASPRPAVMLTFELCRKPNASETKSSS